MFTLIKMDKSTKYDIVKKAIDCADPYGLLKIGAPDDEYEVEAADIAEAISSGDSEEKIAGIIANIFAKEFNWEVTAENFRGLARNIRNELHKIPNGL